jgi:hypothetical protein
MFAELTVCTTEQFKTAVMILVVVELALHGTLILITAIQEEGCWRKI